MNETKVKLRVTTEPGSEKFWAAAVTLDASGPGTI